MARHGITGASLMKRAGLWNRDEITNHREESNGALLDASLTGSKAAFKGRKHARDTPFVHCALQIG